MAVFLECYHSGSISHVRNSTFCDLGCTWATIMNCFFLRL